MRILLAAAVCAMALRGAPKTVVIFALDGLGANVLRANMPPHFRELQQHGAFTLKARGVMPTVTFPNFGSMLSGAGPEQHGIISNDWRPDRAVIAPSCTGIGGHFPTIFGLLRAQHPSAKVAMFFDGDGFPFIVEQGVPDKIGTAQGPDATFAMAMDYIAANHPDLVFLHVDLLDHAGHTEGWESAEYARQLLHADDLLGQLMTKVHDSVLLVSSDHGGIGKRHGGTTMTELEIPWMITGQGIARGKEIAAPVNTFDTASTLARIFGLKQPSCWIGKPVMEAFTR
jgi:predicted AlkP superfamily pyrophosphatase or phosphodiesterase